MEVWGRIDSSNIRVAGFTPDPPCHTEGKYLFNIGKARIHAGGYKAADLKDWALIINLRGLFNSKLDLHVFGGAAKLCPRFIGSQPVPKLRPELVIEWPDGSIPDIKRKDWRQLVSDLEILDGDILIHCMGGHGRTGTLLAILAGITNTITGDVVKVLREQYCKKIVESQTQIDYLKKRMQVRTEEEPRYYFRGDLYGRQDYSCSLIPTHVPGLPDRYPAEHTNPTGVQSVHDTPGQFFTCEICHTLKIRAYMYTHFSDGKGTCYRCHYATDPHNTYEL